MSHYNAASEGRGGGHAIVLHISSDSAVSIILAAAGNRCSWNRCFMLISTDWERTFQPTVHFSLFPLPIPGSRSSSTAVSCKPVCSIQAPRSHFINQTQPRTSPRSQSTLAAFLGGNASVAVRDAGPIVLKLVRCHNSLRKTAWVGDLFLVSSINCLLERERHIVAFVQSILLQMKLLGESPEFPRGNSSMSCEEGQSYPFLFVKNFLLALTAKETLLAQSQASCWLKSELW